MRQRATNHEVAHPRKLCGLIQKAGGKFLQMRRHLDNLSGLSLESVTRKQLNLSAAEIAVTQMSLDRQSLHETQGATSIAQERFRRRAPRRFAECSGAETRLHVLNRTLVQLHQILNTPLIPETVLRIAGLSSAISTIKPNKKILDNVGSGLLV